jgi:riboflavin synthase
MFTGIIEELGTVYSLSRTGNSAQLTLKSSICYTESKQGDSISVNGCCLTVIKKNNSKLVFDVSSETLSSSNLSDLAEGEKVNLERSLVYGGRLDGHFVSGHIDYAGRIISKSVNSSFIELNIGVDKGFNGFFAAKGSVAVDGVSLTVNKLLKDSFKVMLIPHTLLCTTLQYKDKGCRVNIETDILAKYVHSFLNKTPVKHTPYANINKDFLSQYGFM